MNTKSELAGCWHKLHFGWIPWYEKGSESEIWWVLNEHTWSLHNSINPIAWFNLFLFVRRDSLQCLLTPKMDWYHIYIYSFGSISKVHFRTSPLWTEKNWFLRPVNLKMHFFFFWRTFFLLAHFFSFWCKFFLFDFGHIKRRKVHFGAMLTPNERTMSTLTCYDADIVEAFKCRNCG